MSRQPRARKGGGTIPTRPLPYGPSASSISATGGTLLHSENISDRQLCSSRRGRGEEWGRSVPNAYAWHTSRHRPLTSRPGPGGGGVVPYFPSGPKLRFRLLKAGTSTAPADSHDTFLVSSVTSDTIIPRLHLSLVKTFGRTSQRQKRLLTQWRQWRLFSCLARSNIPTLTAIKRTHAKTAIDIIL